MTTTVEPDMVPGAAPAPPRPPPIAENLLDLVGNTPLVRLPKLNRGLRPTLLAKLEMFNPGENVKFELEVPDTENYKDIAGRKVEFDVAVKKVEVVTLPATHVKIGVSRSVYALASPPRSFSTRSRKSAG